MAPGSLANDSGGVNQIPGFNLAGAIVSRLQLGDAGVVDIKLIHDDGNPQPRRNATATGSPT